MTPISLIDLEDDRTLKAVIWGTAAGDGPREAGVRAVRGHLAGELVDGDVTESGKHASAQDG